MSFNGYLLLVTLAGLILRWVLFELWERKSDAESFLMFMLTYSIPQDPRAKGIMFAYVLAAGGIGFLVVG